MKLELERIHFCFCTLQTNASKYSFISYIMPLTHIRYVYTEIHTFLHIQTNTKVMMYQVVSPFSCWFRAKI